MSAQKKRWLHRGLTLAFIAFVVWLFSRKVNQIDFAEVVASLQKIPAMKLAGAATLTCLSYIIYAAYEALARSYTGHRIRLKTIGLVAFVSYTFNFNFGAVVGGLGFRYRLYSRLGLDKFKIAQVVGFATLTNWVGYLFITGLVFLMAPPFVPANLDFPIQNLRWVGGVLMILLGLYLMMCFRWGKKSMNIRGHRFRLPALRLGLTQMTVAAMSWLVIAGVLWMLFPPAISYFQVLSIFLIASLAGAMAHIPGGLGVLEAVFITMMEGTLSASEALAYVLAFRVVYYFLPLLLASLIYFLLEVRHRPKRSSRSPFRQAGQGAQG